MFGGQVCELVGGCAKQCFSQKVNASWFQITLGAVTCLSLLKVSYA